MNSSSDEEDDDEVPMLVSISHESSLHDGAANIPRNLTAEDAVAPSAPPPVASSTRPPCPVTILSGFLGSGKTTLVKYILQSPDHGKRIAVIENEFGGDSNSNAPLSIESMIARDGLTSNSLQDFIELPNGCICCTVKDSLVLTLEQLLDKRADLDYILIECSGLANPGPIASIFWLDDALESRLQLDGIVTLVDAVQIERQLKETVEASQQIAYADRVILNKIDLLPDFADVDRLCRVIRGLHPTAAIQTASYSAVPNLGWILETGCFDAVRAQDVLKLQLPNSALETSCAPSCSGMNHWKGGMNHDNGELYCGICAPSDSTEHRHTAGVSTISLHVPGSVKLSKVNQWLASILWPHQDAIARDEHLITDAFTDNNTVASVSHVDSSRTQANSGAASDHEQQQIYRLKGILSVWFVPSNDDCEDGDALRFQVEAKEVESRALDRRRYIVQGVYDLWDIHACTSTDLYWKDDAGDERCSKLIVIGRHLNRAELQAGFESCR